MPSILRYMQCSPTVEQKRPVQESLLQTQVNLPASHATATWAISSPLEHQKPSRRTPQSNGIKQDGRIIPKHWKWLSVPGYFSKRSTLNTDPSTDRNTQLSSEGKRPKGFNLTECIKQILSPKRPIIPHPYISHYQDQTSISRSEPEHPSINKLSFSLGAHSPDLPESFRPKPTDVGTNPSMLAAIIAVPRSRHSSSSVILKPKKSLIELAILDDPTRCFGIPRNPAAVSGAHVPHSDRLIVPHSSPNTQASTSIQPCRSGGYQTGLYGANASDVGLLDGIVDFFESFGAGFQALDLDLDTFGMDSPEKIDQIKKVCAFGERVVEP